jgi:hypothetical protein
MACIMIRELGRAGSPSCMFSDFHDSADVNQLGQSRLLAVVESVPKSRVIDVDNRTGSTPLELTYPTFRHY